MDALGLGFFTAIGAIKTKLVSDNYMLIIMLSTITAVGGGILRDILVRRNSTNN